MTSSTWEDIRMLGGVAGGRSACIQLSASSLSAMIGRELTFTNSRQREISV